MPVEIPAGPRYTIAERPGELSITIPATRYWYVIPFLFVWLCFWCVGEAFGVGLVVGCVVGFPSQEEGAGGHPLGQQRHRRWDYWRNRLELVRQSTTAPVMPPGGMPGGMVPGGGGAGNRGGGS